MFRITLPADRAVTDMAAVAKAFGIGIDDLEAGIHVGTISRWLEVGEGNEDNKPHQILASEKLGIRVDVDEYGNVRSARKYGTKCAQLQPHRKDHDDAGRGMDANGKTAYSQQVGLS